MSGFRKAKGYQAETIAEQHYLEQGYSCRQKNYTIPWGELDLILQKGMLLVFVEVKCVDQLEDYAEHISPRKYALLERSIEQYCQQLEEGYEIRLDVVFVRWGKVIDVFENVTN